MRAVIARELTLIARRPALTAAMCAYVGLLGAFPLAWSQGVPLLPGANLYEQQRLVDWTLIAVLLPWMAVRCGAPERGDRLATLSALTAVRPSSIVIGKVAALAGVLVLAVCAGLPALFIAQQMAAVPALGVVRDTAAMFGPATLIAAVAVSWTLAARGRLTAWIGATVTTALAMGMLWRWTTSVSAAAAAMLLAVALTAWTAGATDRSMRYCHE